MIEFQMSMKSVHQIAKPISQVKNNIAQDANPDFNRFHPYVQKFFTQISKTIEEAPYQTDFIDGLQKCYDGFWDLRLNKLYYPGQCRAKDFLRCLKKNIEVVNAELKWSRARISTDKVTKIDKKKNDASVWIAPAIWFNYWLSKWLISFWNLNLFSSSESSFIKIKNLNH